MDKNFWDKVERLEELAGKATQGEWSVNDLSKIISIDGNTLCLAYSGFDSDGNKWDGNINASYIAAANPAMIKEMIATFNSRISFLEHALVEKDIEFENTKAEMRWLEKEANWLAGEIVSWEKDQALPGEPVQTIEELREAARKAIAENLIP